MTALAAPSGLVPSRMNVAEFRAFQEAHPREKWQLVDGRLYAMTGGTVRHARIISNLAFALRRRLQGGPCEVFIAEANAVREDSDFSSYPDVVVRCGGAMLDLEREMSDPTACFEVLSPSTKHLDRGDKLFAYQQMQSLSHVALVFAEEVRVEAWARVEGALTSGCSSSLATLWRWRIWAWKSRSRKFTRASILTHEGPGAPL